MCDCIERKEAELREATGDPEAFLETIFDVTEKRRGLTQRVFTGQKSWGYSAKTLRFPTCILIFAPFAAKNPAYVNKHGRVYLQDLFGEKVFLKPCDYAEHPPEAE
jgi:hypothetical protein